MALTNHQREILKIISQNRSPESHISGGSAVNLTARRISRDLDIFHDTERGVAAAAQVDAASLVRGGFEIEWVRQSPSMHTAIVRKAGEETRIDWAQDSAFRFFPAQRDETFGYVLHPIDLATNKALAAAGRREPRDIVDLVEIHRSRYLLALVVWAAVAKDPGYSPESLVDTLRRNGRYQQAEFDALDATEPLDAGEIQRSFRDALDDAAVFVARMPSEQAGSVFLDGEAIVLPDPEKLGSYRTRQASHGGVWPTPS